MSEDPDVRYLTAVVLTWLVVIALLVILLAVGGW